MERARRCSTSIWRGAILALRIGLVAAAGMTLAVDARSQVTLGGDPESTPEVQGAVEGRIDGRRSGIENGTEIGRSQALVGAWLRGFQLGLDQPESWRRDSAADEGRAEGERPGLAQGLELGRERGRQGCADAYAQLRGRPTRRTEAPPPAPPPPAPPPFRACEPPPVYRLQLHSGRRVDLDPRHAETQDSPLGWSVPDPDYPEGSTLRQRAREDGHEGDALIAWIRGYKDAFRDEFVAAFRAHRDMTPGGQLASLESEGLTAGRHEGERRRNCDDFSNGFVAGFRSGFDDGFARGWEEGWDEADQLHADNPVVRIASAELVDAGDDGVIEPGEDAWAVVELLNAGMRDAPGDVLLYEGIVSVAARGSVRDRLRAQSRRSERIDLGRIDVAAPFGAGIDVQLRALNGDERRLATTVGRPVILESASATLDVLDGHLVARVRPLVRNVARRATERDLRVVAGPAPEAQALLGTMEPGASLEPSLMVPASPDALADPISGDVDLRSGEVPGEAAWMRRAWSHAPRMGESVALAGRLPLASADLDAGLNALARRLQSELGQALADPKLYRRLEEGSDLSELGQALRSVPATHRPLFEQRLAGQLLARADAKGTPRKVRKAIRESLGRE